MNALENHFKIQERGSGVATEIRTGITTSVTMDYILFVNYALSGQGA